MKKDNLGWWPTDEKLKEQRRNLDWTQDGVLMMRNQRNKEETEIEPMGVSQPLETKEKTIRFRQNLGWCPNDENSKETKNKLRSNL